MLLILVKDIPRIWFIIANQLISIAVVAPIFALYYKYFAHFSPFVTMAIAMISLFLVDFIWWKFIYTGKQSYLNFLDWILPAFLVASTIYFVGLLISK